MVQLSPSHNLNAPLEPKLSADGEEKQREQLSAGSPKVENRPGGLNSLQVNLDVSTAYHGYETYIEDGLICLKHKVRNLEKKKLKLKDYKKRLVQGEVLNKDQMAAVEKYEEVLHNLEFARELDKTLDGLTQNLLKAQKKVVKKEQIAKMEIDKRRLVLVLQFQHLLGGLQQEHIQKDLMAGLNHAPYIPAHQLQSLNQLAALLGVKRDGLSLEEQMDQAALVYMDLLDGKDKPVAGSTYKLLKDELIRLSNYKYFSCLPPSSSKTPDLSLTLASQSAVKSMPKEHSMKNYKEDFQSVREQEPPDSWDAEFPDGPLSPQTAFTKPWKGAAVFIPKVFQIPSKKRTTESKQRKEKKIKAEQNAKSPNQMNILVEAFSSALPKEPILRKQHLENLMTKIHGSFSFMQDSLLDGETLVTNSTPILNRRSSGSLSPLAQGCLRSPSDILARTMHSTPLPPRLMEPKASVTSDLEPSSNQSPGLLQLASRKKYFSPPPYHREAPTTDQEENCRCMPGTNSGKQSPCNGLSSNTSTPPKADSFSTPPMRRALTTSHFQNIHSVSFQINPVNFALRLPSTAAEPLFNVSDVLGWAQVFKVDTSLPQNGELHYKSRTAVCSGPKYSTASTQTPPEFAPPDDEPQMVYPLDYSSINSGEIFLSPSLSDRGLNRSSQSYTRGSVRGMAHGGKALAWPYWSSGWHRGGSYIPTAHLRESVRVLYAARDSGYQHMYRRGGRHGSSAAWSDSSQVSSPDREGAFTVVDSGHEDSLSVSTAEVPLTPHSHPPTALLPMPLYPLSQPLRVAFTASRTANFAPGNLDQPIVFDQLHSNLGEMYDTHIGRFTCPMNGTYVFIFHILKLAINVPLYINLMRNEEVMVSAYANDGAPDHETASNHAILPLFQGDQVWLRLHRGAIYGSTWKYSTFSGFLLYQD
ncbi:caprin-2 isoform X3 [Girardinichthys multiradiatus]|uniref:caprin-2 isoform X3 n=1 Tax=Girardinichthys multiradiatus TaxID=208333 RepID=UPI001FAD4DD9|nr:caprin-2 isoform X3 [Girardinichthys multiradiatus]